MIRLLLVAVVFFIFADARENPFAPADKKQKEYSPIEILNYKYGTIKIKNKIYIYTGDSINKKFFLLNPCRIVLDFKRDSDMETKKITNMPNTPFKSLTIGSHSGYYRVVIETKNKCDKAFMNKHIVIQRTTR